MRQDDVPLSAQTTALTALAGLPPDLAKLAATWPKLHEAVRAGIMAMVSTGQKTDFTIQIKVREQAWDLLVEAKDSGQPRVLRQEASQLRRDLAPRPTAYGVLVAPFISADGARVCEELGVGYLDLAGNCRLAFGTVFVERQRRPTPFAVRRDLLSTYRPKAARVLRVLLADPKCEWKMKTLGAEAGEARCQAVCGLGKLGDNRAVPLLVKALSDPDRNMRNLAKACLDRHFKWIAANDTEAAAAAMATHHLDQAKLYFRAGTTARCGSA